MIDPVWLHGILVDEGVVYVAGVPDSLLKGYCACVEALSAPGRHLICANEGTAVATAAGYHLATGGVAAVYMQNSGLGNAINPLLSLADREVYAIPMVLLIGWRGEPGERDEPQHVKQGRVTPAILEAIEMPYRVIGKDPTVAEPSVRWAIQHARNEACPVALLFERGTVGPFRTEDRNSDKPPPALAKITRESAVEHVVSALSPGSVIVSTTGKISRELYEYRVRSQSDRSFDFLTIGAMGHASQIALGIAAAWPTGQVACLDGDGSVLMHMGGMAIIGASAPKNLKHIVLNNGAHESVGGQPTVALHVDLTDVARACRYRHVLNPVFDAAALSTALGALVAEDGPGFLEVRVALGSRADLGRPGENPIDSKRVLMETLWERARAS